MLVGKFRVDKSLPQLEDSRTVLSGGNWLGEYL